MRCILFTLIELSAILVIISAEFVVLSEQVPYCDYINACIHNKLDPVIINSKKLRKAFEAMQNGGAGAVWLAGYERSGRDVEQPYTMLSIDAQGNPQLGHIADLQVKDIVRLRPFCSDPGMNGEIAS